MLSSLSYGQEFQTQEDLKEAADTILTRPAKDAITQRMPEVLLAAVRGGDRGILKFWLDECWRDWGIDINAREEESGETVLHKAVYYPSYDIVDCLLGRGADVDATDCTGCTPLLRAELFGGSCVEVVKLLLQHGADVTATDEMGDNALHRCVSLQSTSSQLPDLVTTLLAWGADPDAKNADGDTPLTAAIKKAARPDWRNRLVDCIELLAYAVNDIDAVDGAGRTALHLVAHDHPETPGFDRIAMVLRMRGL